MKTFDNVNSFLKDDLKKEIRKDSRIGIVASCFSIYAFQELKEQLESVDDFRFIFSPPSFVKEKEKKSGREFYIPRAGRERSIYGTEFEVRLRNELVQKSIAKECAEWIKKKAVFKSNTTDANLNGYINVENKEEDYTYMTVNGFTASDIGAEGGDSIYNVTIRLDSPASKDLLNKFEEIWNNEEMLEEVTDTVLESISMAYRENSPEFIYFVTLYNIFSEFLEDISEDALPNESTGFKDSKIWSMLYEFQKDAVLAIISKLEQYNGCILADSVGLGKTFTALAVIKYYENRNRSVLVLCPKKLSENWNTYREDYINNPIASDRLNYRILYHTDLSRESGKSHGNTDLSRLNWGNYDLVVIDESHNFRNGGELSGEDGDKENRYLKLMNKVIKSGVKTKVLMLSATPVNNRFNDLKNQIALAYEGDSEIINEKLNVDRPIDDIFRSAQRAFNNWSKLEHDERNTSALLEMLDFDFFEVLDSVTIARSRKHIEKYYDAGDVGKFPERLAPISRRPDLTNLSDAINYNEIYENIISLNLRIYSPSKYIFDSRISKYQDKLHNKGKSLTQSGREEGIRRLMSINLLKRLESSVHSFKLTLNRIKELIAATVEKIDNYDIKDTVLELQEIGESSEFDFDDQNMDYFSVGKKVKIDLSDMDYKSWRDELSKDLETLELLTLMIGDITPEHDSKLQELFSIVRDKIENPINRGNRKVIVFTAFSDTAEYLYEHISLFAKNEFGLETGLVTGSIEGRTTIPKLKADMNNLLTCFSPISKDKHLLMPTAPEIDILVATDCISEGQNLQDCDYLVNYDIHWNPVRIIQRFGRIDRIGSRNDAIQLVNFWPNLDLDEYINLKARVEARMKITVMTSTGTADEDPLDEKERADLEYRKDQLERLQREVVDLEDMSSGISIMDLGLNEYRLDLLEYLKQNPEAGNAPNGLHGVVSSSEELPPGVIYVMKNIKQSVDIDRKNRLHPFYIVYISKDGEVVLDHLAPKELLNTMRLHCKGKAEPNTELCESFNSETSDGKDMAEYSELLSRAINSIIDVKEESDIDSLFSSGGTTALLGDIKGIDDFELVCFLVVR